MQMQLHGQTTEQQHTGVTILLPHKHRWKENRKKFAIFNSIFKWPDENGYESRIETKEWVHGVAAKRRETRNAPTTISINSYFNE